MAALTVSLCVPPQALAQEDVTICRGPGFYQTHSGYEKETANVAQEILDAVGGITVCDNYIFTTTDLGGLDSALEALCVRTRGEEERQLYRHLVTADLNCQVSEGADCDEITSRFIEVLYSECDALCAGDPVEDGPTVEECTYQLACFNGGGRVIEGVCYRGTCDDDGETLCTNDEDCDDEIECVRFEDSCARSQFCSEDLDANAKICPKKGAASSPKTCREARKNDCTVDAGFGYCGEACSDYEPCVEACESVPDCDPELACQTEETCYDACYYYGFGSDNCQCVNWWDLYCQETSIDEDAYVECLSEYALAEFYGFCDYCSADPANCD